ncbi:MAG: hypothetical protein FWF75_10560, partial [Propionibacteriaceae bacterium]|nr:hypothetical protein [Propionibacteriaceae bacterium]
MKPPWKNLLDKAAVRGEVSPRTILGWDMFVLVYAIVVGLSVAALTGPVQRWIVPVVVLLAWYAIAGRRALKTRDPRWRTVFLTGCLGLLCWGVAKNAWMAPLEGLVLVLMWWLALPDRRLAVLWSVLVPL